MLYYTGACFDIPFCIKELVPDKDKAYCVQCLDFCLIELFVESMDDASWVAYTYSLYDDKTVSASIMLSVHLSCYGFLCFQSIKSF